MRYENLHHEGEKEKEGGDPSFLPGLSEQRGKRVLSHPEEKKEKSLSSLIGGEHGGIRAKKGEGTSRSQKGGRKGEGLIFLLFLEKEKQAALEKREEGG